MSFAALGLRTKAAIIVGLILAVVLGINVVFTTRQLGRELRLGLQAKAGVLGRTFVKDAKPAI